MNELLSVKLRTFLQKAKSIEHYEIINPFYIILYGDIDKMRAEVKEFAPCFGMRLRDDRILLDTTGTGVYDERTGATGRKERVVKEKVVKKKKVQKSRKVE